jgi:hypothetical protein
MEASLGERILAFASAQTGVNREKIRLETTLPGTWGLKATTLPNSSKNSADGLE